MKKDLIAYSCDRCHVWLGDPLRDRWTDTGMEWRSFLGHDFCSEDCAQNFVAEALIYKKEEIRHREATKGSG